MKGVIRYFLRLFGGDAFSDPKYSVGVLLKCLIVQKLLRVNADVSWPVHMTSTIKAPQNVEKGSRMPGLAPGVYIDGRNGIIIGENTWIGPGVRLISQNHSVEDYNEYLECCPIRIGRDCWLASGVTILAGVQLGDHTVVAAGAVVTKSFSGSNQMLAGVPARLIKKLEPYNVQL